MSHYYLEYYNPEMFKYFWTLPTLKISQEKHYDIKIKMKKNEENENL